MELLFEFIFEIVFEGIFELGTSSKVPKWLRYPIIVILVLFYGTLIVLPIVLGIVNIKKDIFEGLVLIGIGIFIGVLFVLAFIKRKTLKSGGEKIE